MKLPQSYHTLCIPGNWGMQRRHFSWSSLSSLPPFSSWRHRVLGTRLDASDSSKKCTPTYDSSTSNKALESALRVVRERRSSKRFDPTRAVDLNLVDELLTASVRAPTAFNLQPWAAIVVHEHTQRVALSQAALGQLQPLEAPVSVVFAGDMEPERRAPAALELGLNTNYYKPLYGASYLRSVYYHLHGGPLGVMAHAKSCLSSIYSRSTGTPMLSVPTTMQGYAWKQAMIPATTFLFLATAASLDTAILEGLDEAKVREVVGLPDRYTVPVIVSVGYKAVVEGKTTVQSPRFDPRELIRWGKF
ncbi:putative NADH dehydrogenase [Trypanosoma vivax]|nr:putative NADH dehydrogenase [Trypanosoma vivax]